MTDLDDNAPITVGFLKQILEANARALDAKLDARFTMFESRLDARFTAMDDRITAVRSELVESIEDMETKLLKEFRKWAVRIESVGRVNEARSIGLDQRIAVLEERLNDLEDRP